MTSRGKRTETSSPWRTSDCIEVISWRARRMKVSQHEVSLVRRSHVFRWKKLIIMENRDASMQPTCLSWHKRTKKEKEKCLALSKDSRFFHRRETTERNAKTMKELDRGCIVIVKSCDRRAIPSRFFRQPSRSVFLSDVWEHDTKYRWFFHSLSLT